MVEGKAADRDTAVVLLNMGGPDSLAAVGPFLKRLFSDPLLIRFPGGKLCQPLWAAFITRVRTKAAQERYALIGGKSPIGVSSEAQRQALAAELQRRGRKLRVEVAFNYSSPDTSEAVAKLRLAGIRQILPLSLYPQPSRSTTGSSLAALCKAAGGAFRILSAPDYDTHPGYIEALAARILEAVPAGASLQEYHILFSAHGLPMYAVNEGDIYPQRVSATIALVLQCLGREKGWSLSWQSAAGPIPWIRPYTEDIIPDLARQGIRKLIVVPVSFVSDHIETLCEVDIEYRAVAARHGITDFVMSRAIETHPAFIRALAESVERAWDC